MSQHRPLSALMALDWAQALTPVEPLINHIGDQLVDLPFLPAGHHVLRAFARPMSKVKVLVVGQDPYPTPRHPIGLSFAVDKNVTPLPKSLLNIYTELHHDLGIPPCSHGDLSRWSEQGVMLLNRNLTVAPGEPGSHGHLGWQGVTTAAVEALAQRHRLHRQPLVGILWGSRARELTPVLEDAGVPIITSAHPSPLSAHRGFFGSRPFSRTNELLARQGATPIDWRVC